VISFLGLNYDRDKLSSDLQNSKTMTQPSLHFVECPGANTLGRPTHRMAYWQWGQADASHVIVCAHGLSRQGRDFDVLAQALVARAQADGVAVRVVCPDVVGRGKSDWLKDPMGYQIPSYAADMLAMLGQIKPVKLDWIGTSMGGLIGMVICGQPGLPLPAPVRRLVLNDVGPAIQWEALQRIGLYLGNAPRFASLEQAATAMWAISTSFGPHTPAQWLELSRHMVKPIDDAQGGVALHYDPAIAVPFKTITQESAAAGEAAIWALYDQITAKTLLVRGAVSDLLSTATAEAMTQRGPKARLVEFDGVGHAPTFVADDQVKTAVDFLFA
jgi:pimeloyl-ACP methyl ester carboxylesterase